MILFLSPALSSLIMTGCFGDRQLKLVCKFGFKPKMIDCSEINVGVNY